MAHNFENLEVWRRSVDMAVGVLRLTKDWREYALRDQMLRSAVSISSNIAEGSERGSDLEFRRFLGIAKGSAAELRTQVIIAGKSGLIADEVCMATCSELVELSRMLQGLALSRKKGRVKPDP
jgi:four helix bundle protein